MARKRVQEIFGKRGSEMVEMAKEIFS